MAILKFKRCNKENFIKSISVHKEDKFAKTFLSKANMQNQWSYCVGLYDEDELMGAILLLFL